MASRVFKHGIAKYDIELAIFGWKTVSSFYWLILQARIFLYQVRTIFCADTRDPLRKRIQALKVIRFWLCSVVCNTDVENRHVFHWTENLHEPPKDFATDFQR